MPDKSLQGSKLEAAINIAQKAELFTIIGGVVAKFMLAGQSFNIQIPHKTRCQILCSMRLQCVFLLKVPCFEQKWATKTD